MHPCYCANMLKNSQYCINQEYQLLSISTEKVSEPFKTLTYNLLTCAG